MKINNPFPSGCINKMLETVEIPEFIKIRQSLPNNSLEDNDLILSIDEQMLPFLSAIKANDKIGITVGSRGIDRIDMVLARVVYHIKRIGAIPYIIPCMGSHGINIEGRKRILTGIGVTEEKIGCKIENHDEVTKIGETESGLEVYVDSFILTCDKIIVFNRVKPHTAFHGPIESGLQKMIAVGMGKQKGASICHKKGFYDICDRIIEISDYVLKTQKIFMGIAVVENAYGKISQISIMKGDAIKKLEPEILKHARDQMPSLPFHYSDILIVDEMGKNISGSGMDTNIIGRYPLNDIKGNFFSERLVCLSLSKASEGNAHGMGFADFIPLDFLNDVDFEHTFPNGLTNKTPAPAKIPVVMPDKICAIKAAIQTCSNENKKDVKIVWIKNTHDIDEIYVTKSLINEIIRPFSIVEKNSIIKTGI